MYGFAVSHGREVTFVDLLLDSVEKAMRRLAEFENWVRTGDGKQVIAESNPRMIDSIIGIYTTDDGVKTLIPFHELIGLKESFGTDVIKFTCMTKKGEIIVPAVSESDVVRILELHGFDLDSIDISWSVGRPGSSSRRTETRSGKSVQTLVREARLPVDVLAMFRIAD